MISKELKLPRYEVAGLPTDLNLFLYQKKIYEKWNNNKSFLILSGTGSGKTIAAVLPILMNNESVICIYPTNALIENQKKSIINLFKMLGKKYQLIDENTYQQKYNLDIDYTIVKIDRILLEKIKKTKILKLMVKHYIILYLIIREIQ